MLNKSVKHKNSLLVFLLRLLLGLVLFDEKNRFLKKSTQLYPIIPHYLDRLIEVLMYYPISFSRFVSTVRKYGYPTSEEYKSNFNKEFQMTDPKNLFQSYSQFDEIYTLRLMLAYNRIDFIVPYIEILKKNGVISVLDYGSGVSDIGVLLARRGFKVSIVDLQTPKIMFTRKRFELRGLQVEPYPVDDTEKLADIDKKFDLIIATEILEHFRNPIKMINYFYDHLSSKGYIYVSMGRNFVRETGGDHLDESLKEGQSAEYWDNFKAKFSPIDDNYLLFRKV